MGSAVAAFSIIASQEMQNLVVEPFVFRAKSAQTLEWGWEDVALAGCVATALTSIAIVVVAVIFRCNKLAQQRETEKARFADKSASSKTSHEQAEMETTTRRPKVPKPKEDKRKPTAAPVETPDVPASPTRVPLRLTSSSSAKNTTAKNQATVAKGPQVGATFNFQARRAFRCQ